MNRRDMPGRCHGCGGILPPTRRAWCHKCFVPGMAERRRNAVARAGGGRRLTARQEHGFFLFGLASAVFALPMLAGGSWWALVPLSITAALWRSVILYGEAGR